MSAMDPPLQERVYLGLKADYLAGHFVPGKRIDIQDLANRHHSSKTPVREAAFIFVGEGLFMHHADGGFLVPTPTPLELIELLRWHMQMIMACISGLRESALRSSLRQYSTIVENSSAVAFASRAMEIFTSLADAGGNTQASIHIRRLNERLHYTRIADAGELKTAERELSALTSPEVADFRKALRRRIEAYHLRKICHQQKIIHTGKVMP
ncbi:GntR family transcriptional regulator [Novosphingobium sp. CF614]|uniref:GntR family transcriptional regulator n=1 Tax=Novosphingobium sp. CF614 TaxID=1884364 RepID=UPI0015A55AA4|nr:GntR family transcriptional regulator [Novosphingobium sp. CF614]